MVRLLMILHFLIHDVEVKYTEDGEIYNSVEGTVNEDLIHIYGLDHFTVFVVSNVDNSGSCAGALVTPPSGSPACYTTITLAIDNAAIGDTIWVSPGTYEEDLIIDVEGVTIASTNGIAQTTIRGNTIELRANNITLDGFRIDNNGGERAIGPRSSDGAVIKNNLIQNSFRGIQGDWHGRPTNLTIQNNIFNTSYGLAGTEDMLNVNILDNTFRTSEEGIGVGEGISFTTNFSNLFSDNTFEITGGIVLGDYRVGTLMPTKYTSEGDLLVQAGDSIQAVIDVAKNGDVIEVAAGTYNESLTIGKELTLRGPNAGISAGVNAESRKDEAIIVAQSTIVAIFVNQANIGSVTVDGFRVADNSAWVWGGIGQGSSAREGTTVHFLNNIVEAPPTVAEKGYPIQVTGDGSTVIGNRIQATHMTHEDWSAAGISVSNASNVFVENNLIIGHSGSDAGITVQNTGVVPANITINSNEIRETEWGIYISAYKGNLGPVDITNNHIQNNNYGLRLTNFDNEENQIFLRDVSNNTFNNNTQQVSYHESFDDETTLGVLGDILSDNTFDRAVVVRENPIVVPTIFSSIQDAINAASDGNTVEVYPGTYTENFNIDVPNLTLRSKESRDVTTIDANGAFAAITVSSNLGDVTVQGFTVENYVAIGVGQSRFQNEGTAFHVLNNRVNPPLVTTQHGNSIQVTGDGSTVIENILSVTHLDSQDYSGSGILVYIGDNILVKGNHVSAVPNGDRGIVVLGGSVYDSPNITQSAIIRDNIIENCEIGIMISADAHNTILEENTVLNNTVGIKVQDHEGLVPINSIVNFNSIVGNTADGIVNDSIETLDATSNWWGNVTGPSGFGSGLGDSVSANVDYCPWLDSINGDPVESCDLTTRPIVQITSPNEDDYFSGTIDVEVEASDHFGIGSYYIRLWEGAPHQGTHVGNCQQALGGTNLGTERTDTCTFEISTLPDGEYHITAQYQGILARGGEDTLRVNIDNTLPIVELTSVEAGEFYRGTIDFRGTAIEENPESYRFLLRYMQDGGGKPGVYNSGWVPINEDFTDMSFLEWDSTTSQYGDGVYRVRLDVRDKAGNWKHDLKDIIVDNTGPEIEILSPEGNTAHAETFDIQVRASDNLSGLAQFVVNIQYEGSHIAPCVNENAQGVLEHTVTCTIDTTQFSQGDGNYSIKTNVLDRAGNRSTTLTRHFIFDNTDPEGTIDYIYYDSKGV